MQVGLEAKRFVQEDGYSNDVFFIISCDENDEVICQTIVFSHGKQDVLFQLSEESDGTVTACIQG